MARGGLSSSFYSMSTPVANIGPVLGSNRKHTGSAGTLSAALEIIRYARVPKSLRSASDVEGSLLIIWQSKIAQK